MVVTSKVNVLAAASADRILDCFNKNLFVSWSGVDGISMGLVGNSGNVSSSITNNDDDANLILGIDIAMLAATLLLLLPNNLISRMNMSLLKKKDMKLNLKTLFIRSKADAMSQCILCCTIKYFFIRLFHHSASPVAF